MKNLLFSLLITFPWALFSQAFSLDSNIIEFNLGISTTNFSQIETDVGGTRETSSLVYGLPVFGITGEKLLNKDFGIGFECTYTEALWEMNGAFTNDRFSILYRRIRILPTFNFHFIGNEMTRKNNDLFLSLGIGYRYANLEITDKNGNPWIGSVFFESLFEFPVSSKLSLGYRYNFNNGMTLKTEMSMGGPVLRFGLGYSF